MVQIQEEEVQLLREEAMTCLSFLSLQNLKYRIPMCFCGCISTGFYVGHHYSTGTQIPPYMEYTKNINLGTKNYMSLCNRQDVL